MRNSNYLLIFIFRGANELPLQNDMIMEEDEPQLLTGMDNVRARQAPPGFQKPVPMSKYHPVEEDEKAEPIRKEVERNIPHDEQILPALLNVGKAPREEERQLPVNHDEQVLPALAGAVKQDYSVAEVNEKAEPLSAQAKKTTDPYTGIFEVSLLQMLFSKTWNLREEGLDILETEISSKQYENILIDNKERIAINVCGLVSHLIPDKIAQVSQKAMCGIETALWSHPSEITSDKPTFTNNIDTIITHLLQKSGDNQVKLRNQSEETLLSISEHPSVTPFHVSSHIIRASQKKTKLSTKHVTARLNLLASIVRKHGADKKVIPLDGVVQYALEGVKNKEQDIRNPAYTLLGLIYGSIGGAIQPYLADLRPAQMEKLQEQFDAIDGGEQLPRPEERKMQPKTTVVTNIKPGGGKGKEKEKEEKPKYKYKNQDPEKVCEYCGKFDAKFTEDALDIHMWKECPMLCFCASCDHVIEIINLNNHLLNECEKESQHRACPICNEAIPLQEYEQHVEESSCSRAEDPEEAIRCPLCHIDVKPPSMDAWRDHILIRQCPNNDRRPS
jgi:hypothetical protein